MEEPEIFRHFSTYFLAGQAGYYPTALYLEFQTTALSCLELSKYLLFP